MKVGNEQLRLAKTIITYMTLSYLHETRQSTFILYDVILNELFSIIDHCSIVNRDKTSSYNHMYGICVSMLIF